MKEFGQALEQFGRYSPADNLAPTWGKAETRALRAAGEADAGNHAAARRDYQAALALAPDYEWAAAELAELPQR